MEVYSPFSGEVVLIEGFSVNRAAEYLDRTSMTFRRYLSEGMVPRPRLKGATSGYMHYSLGEMQLIADSMAQHEEQYDYFYATHTDTVERIWQRLENYRKTRL